MNKNIYAVDIETNGLSRYSCDIIQIGIVDSNLNKLYSSCCKPIKLQTWDLNDIPCKITPESLKDFPTIVEQRDEIVKILNQADVIVSFNGDEFDIPFIEQVLDYKVKAQSYDIMKYAWKEFALYGNKSPMLRPSLADVCNWFGVTNEKEHDAAADAKATMEVFLKMTEESKKPKLITITSFDDGKKIYTEELADKYAKESGAKIVEVKYYEKDSKGLKEIDKPSDLSKYRVGNFVKGMKKQKQDYITKEEFDKLILNKLGKVTGIIEAAKFMTDIYNAAEKGTGFRGYSIKENGLGYNIDFLHDYNNYPDGEAEGDINLQGCLEQFVSELREGEWSTKLDEKYNFFVDNKYYLMCLDENGVNKVYLGENDTEVDDFTLGKLFTKEEAEAKKKELASKGQDYWDICKD